MSEDDRHSSPGKEQLQIKHVIGVSTSILWCLDKSPNWYKYSI